MLWDLAIKHIWRKKLRSLLTIVGVATSVQMYLTFSGIQVYYRSQIVGQLSAFAGKAVIQQQIEDVRGNVDLTASGNSLDAQTAESLLSLAGLDRQASSRMVYVTIARSTLPYMPPAVLAVGVEPGHESAFLGGFRAENGRNTLLGADDVILGQSAAAYYRPAGGPALRAGDFIEIQRHQFTVAGILETAPTLFSDAVVMPLATAQTVFSRPGNVSSVILTAADPQDLPALQSEVEARFPDLTVSTQADLQQSAQTLLDGLNTFMSLISNSIVIVALVIVTIVVAVAVMERRKDIGTLRAVGAGRLRIFSMVAGESLILSMLGALLAMPITIFITSWGMALFAGSGGILTIWLEVIVVSVIIGILASILPAWQALRVDPLEALRYE